MTIFSYIYSEKKLSYTIDIWHAMLWPPHQYDYYFLLLKPCHLYSVALTDFYYLLMRIIMADKVCIIGKLTLL